MPIDFIPLGGCKVRAAPDNKKSFCWILEAPEMEGKTFLIQSNTKVRTSSALVLVPPTYTAQEDMDDWIAKIKAQSSNEISTPFNLSHNLHVDFGTLPDEWRKMLVSSGFTEGDLSQYGQQLTNALTILAPKAAQTTSPAAAGGATPASPKPTPATTGAPSPTAVPKTAAPAKPTPTPSAATPAPAANVPLPSGDSIASLNLEDLVSQENPETIYFDMVKIGEGYAAHCVACAGY